MGESERKSPAIVTVPSQITLRRRLGRGSQIARSVGIVGHGNPRTKPKQLESQQEDLLGRLEPSDAGGINRRTSPRAAQNQTEQHATMPLSSGIVHSTAKSKKTQPTRKTCKE